MQANIGTSGNSATSPHPILLAVIIRGKIYELKALDSIYIPFSDQSLNGYMLVVTPHGAVYGFRASSTCTHRLTMESLVQKKTKKVLNGAGQHLKHGTTVYDNAGFWIIVVNIPEAEQADLISSVQMQYNAARPQFSMSQLTAAFRSLSWNVPRQDRQFMDTLVAVNPPTPWAVNPVTHLYRGTPVGQYLPSNTYPADHIYYHERYFWDNLRIAAFDPLVNYPPGHHFYYARLVNQNPAVGLVHSAAQVQAAYAQSLANCGPAPEPVMSSVVHERAPTIPLVNSNPQGSNGTGPNPGLAQAPGLFGTTTSSPQAPASQLPFSAGPFSLPPSGSNSNDQAPNPLLNVFGSTGTGGATPREFIFDTPPRQVHNESPFMAGLSTFPSGSNSDLTPVIPPIVPPPSSPAPSAGYAPYRQRLIEESLRAQERRAARAAQMQSRVNRNDTAPPLTSSIPAPANNQIAPGIPWIGPHSSPAAHTPPSTHSAFPSSNTPFTPLNSPFTPFPPVTTAPLPPPMVTPPPAATLPSVARMDEDHTMNDGPAATTPGRTTGVYFSVGTSNKRTRPSSRD